MKKNGFVFVESIVVLMVVALSVAMFMSSYSLMSRKVKEKENYDKASDKYLLYSIANLGTDSKCNYGIDCDEEGKRDTEFAASASNCKFTKMGGILYDCTQVFEDLDIKYIYVVKNVRNTLNDYKRNKDGQALDCSGNVIDRDKNPEAKGCKITDNSQKAVNIYDNGAIEYMKTLKKCNDENVYIGEGENQVYVNRNKESDICANPIMYMIGVFNRGNKLYYASIDISGNVKYEETIRDIKSGWVCDNCSVASSVYNQEWKYYINNLTVKGLNKLSTGNSSTSNKYYYYFDPSTGIMITGWVYYDGNYHLFSPIDYDKHDNQGALDGRRIQSMSSSERISVTLKNNSGNTKQFFLDNMGTCYMTQTGGSTCTQTDISEFTGDKITSIDFGSYSGCYSCNGDECNGNVTCN